MIAKASVGRKYVAGVGVSRIAKVEVAFGNVEVPRESSPKNSAIVCAALKARHEIGNLMIKVAYTPKMLKQTHPL